CRKYDDFSSGKKSEFLVTAGDLGRIIRLDLEWRPDQVFYPDQNQVYAQQQQQPGAATPGFDSPRLWIDYIQVRNLATGEKFVFCGEGTFLQPNVAKTLFTGGSCEFEVGSSSP
ncbi:hypothetical protein MTO96_044856, partial [Rhipicephalus appendiculatus]